MNPTILLKAALAGERHAQWHYGMYLHEKGLNRLASVFMARSAKQGCPHGQTNYAACLAYGRYGPRDITRAIDFLCYAGFQGHPEGQYRLYQLLALPDCDSPEIAAIALAWLRCAAQNGYPGASEELAISPLWALTRDDAVSEQEAVIGPEGFWLKPCELMTDIREKRFSAAPTAELVRNCAERFDYRACLVMAELAKNPAVKRFWVEKAKEANADMYAFPLPRGAA